MFDLTETENKDNIFLIEALSTLAGGGPILAYDVEKCLFAVICGAADNYGKEFRESYEVRPAASPITAARYYFEDVMCFRETVQMRETNAKSH